MDNWFQKNLEKNLYGIGKSLIRVFTSAQSIDTNVKTLLDEFKQENQKFTLVVDPKEFALKDGKTPEKFVDYWTEQDIQELLKRLPQPKNGKDGKNADNEKIFKALVKQLPKPEKIDYDKVIKEIKKLFKDREVQEKDIIPQINIIVEKNLKKLPTRKELEQEIINVSIKELDKLLNNPESFAKIARGIEKLPAKEKLDYVKGLKNKPRSLFGGGTIAGFETFTGILGVNHGGTGTDTQFTEGSIVFAGVNGVYSEDNEHFNYHPDYDGSGAPYFIYGGIPKFVDDADPYLPEYRLVFTSDIDSYAGFFLENKNAGQFASTDLIWNNDATREALHYFDIGFNSYEYDWNGSPEDYTAFNQRDRAYIYNVNQGITMLGFQGGLTGESAERAYTVVRSGNTLTVADQSQLVTGRRITYTTTGTPIGGLTSGQYYYILKISSTSVSLSSTMENALDSVVITLSSAGTGVHTITLESSIVSFGGGGASYSNVYLLMLKDGSMLARNSSGGVSYGQDNLATGNNSVAIGTQNTASASQAGAYGYRVLSTAANSQAFGYNFTNSVTNTMALGHGSAAIWITSAGNIGIGSAISNPGAKIEIKSVSNSTGKTIYVTNSSAFDVFQLLDNGTAVFGRETTQLTATPLYVSFGGTYGSGAAGAKENIKWKLYADGTATSTYGIGMTASLMSLQSGSGGGIGFYVNNGTSAMRILSTAFVGIGTIAPETFLHVTGADTSNRMQASIQFASTSGGLSFYNSGPTRVGYIYFTATTMTISRASRDLTFDGQLFITSAGLVGIGNTNPTGFGLLVTNGIIGMTTPDATMRVRNTLSTAYAGMNMFDDTDTLTGSFQIGGSAASVPALAGHLFIGARRSTGNIIFTQGAASTETVRIDASGRVSVGFGASPTAFIHIKAGTATANTAPLKFTSGTKLTTAEAGVHEYNGNHLLSNATVRFSVGGNLFDYFTDTSVGGAEADIYTSTLAANTLNGNGDKIIAEYGINFVTGGTELTQLKVYFAGTAIWDSTAIAPATGTTSARVFVEIIRVSSSVVRYSVSLNTTGASGYVYAAVGELTGLTLSNTAIIKITGTSSGVGSGAGDIVGKMGYVRFEPAA